MMACTSPLFTVRSRPLRIVLPSISTCRFLISSSGIQLLPSIYEVQPALYPLQPDLDRRDIAVIVLLDRDDARQVLADGGHLHAHRMHPIGHLSHLAANG